jgi:hypothetical protein
VIAAETLVSDTKFLTPEYLASLQLKCGSGTGKEGDCCALQERRRWSGLDSKSYAVPDTDSQVCGRFMVRFQDAIKDDAIRNRLIPPLMVKLVGSAGSPELESRRSWMAVDWALREVAPTYFDLTPELAEHAAALRALPPITDKASARAAYPIRDAARTAAWNLREKNLGKLREELKKRIPAADAVAAAADAAAAAVAAAAVAAAVAAVAADAAAAAVAAAVAAVAAAVAVVADADAAAAAAVAAAVAAVAADAAAAAAVAAAVAAVADGSERYWKVYYAVRDALREHFEKTAKTTLREVSLKSWESGAKCLERMLELTEAAQ